MADKELTVGSSGTWWIHTYQDYIKVIHVTFTVGLQKKQQFYRQVDTHKEEYIEE